MPFLNYVATVPTACGIETFHKSHAGLLNSHELQQYLPLAVLKLVVPYHPIERVLLVAIVPTVHGIETFFWKHREYINRKLVATAYGMRRRVCGSRGAK